MSGPLKSPAEYAVECLTDSMTGWVIEREPPSRESIGRGHRERPPPCPRGTRTPFPLSPTPTLSGTHTAALENKRVTPHAHHIHTHPPSRTPPPPVSRIVLRTPPMTALYVSCALFVVNSKSGSKMRSSPSFQEISSSISIR